MKVEKMKRTGKIKAVSMSELSTATSEGGAVLSFVSNGEIEGNPGSGAPK